MRDLAAVDERLSALGLGAFDGAVETSLGRNKNFHGLATTGQRLFVKWFQRDPGGERFNRNHAFEATGSAAPKRPTLILDDAELGIAVYEYIDGVETATLAARENRLTPGHTATMGALVAQLHAVEPVGIGRHRCAMPPDLLFDAMPLEMFLGATGAELEMWRLMQGDPEIVEAIATLRRVEHREDYRTVVVHGDLRLDQFLINDDDVLLTDFEDVRIGDPARDLGAVVGELLYTAVIGIPGRLAEHLPYGAVVGHADILAEGAAAVEEQRPLIAGFMAAYREHGGEVDVQTGERIMRFAGWHMLDRMLVMSERANLIDAVTRGAAGIGRTILVQPSEFLDLLSESAHAH